MYTERRAENERGRRCSIQQPFHLEKESNQVSTNERDLIVGGQAVIEGVMMRTPNAYAIAVRKADGSIVNTSAALPKWSDKYPLLKLPVLRGGAVLIQSMGLGIKALNFSANEAFADAEKAEEKEVEIALTPAVIEGEGDFAGITGAMPGLIPIPTERRSQDELKKGGTAAAAGSIVFALFFNVLLFIVAPLLLTNAIFIAAGWATSPAIEASRAQQTQPGTAASTDGKAAQTPTVTDTAWYTRAWQSVRTYLHPVRPSVSFNLIDGMIRMAFFLIMIFTFSLLKDIRRVFEYHGAEHKTVFTWEAGLPLTVANARIQPRQHPRCGTSFLMVVMLVSIVLFSIIKFDSLIYNMLVRIALIPLVAGLSYEIIRLSAKKEGGFIFKLITLPGVWLQNITTKEPDDQQLEVAIEALKESLKLEPQPREAEATPLA
jgi:Predicted metal-dependent enzyme